MPIEFDCPKCDQLVRTPDAAAGKKGKCPFCKEVVSIPTSSTARAAAVAPPAPAPPAIGPTDVFEFPCPTCAQPMRATGATIGKKGRCAACKSVAVIPAPPAVSAPSAASPLPTASRPTITEEDLLTDFGKAEPKPEPEAKPTPATPATTPAAGGANAWAAWGKPPGGQAPVNPLLAALEDSAKNEKVVTNFFETATQAKAKEKGTWVWDDEERARTGLPYEESPLPEGAWSATWAAVLFNPKDAFGKMKGTGQSGRSTIFFLWAAGATAFFPCLLILGASWLGLAVAISYGLYPMPEGGVGVLTAAIVLVGAASVVMYLLIIPAVFALLCWAGMGLMAGVQHALLMATSGARREFVATYKTTAYATGALLPIYGLLCICTWGCLGWVVPIVFMFVMTAGLSAVHRNETWQSFVAAMPIGLLTMLVWGLFAFMIFQMSQRSPSRPAFNEIFPPTRMTPR